MPRVMRKPLRVNFHNFDHNFAVLANREPSRQFCVIEFEEDSWANYGVIEPCLRVDFDKAATHPRSHTHSTDHRLHDRQLNSAADARISHISFVESFRFACLPSRRARREQEHKSAHVVFERLTGPNVVARA